jgi:hypothetical protein
MLLNGTPETNRLTTIKRHNIFVVGLSVIIAAAFWIVPLLKSNEQDYSYKIYKTHSGWGYDILVNDTLQIHQDFMPVVTAKKGFDNEEQAKAAAVLVIQKLKAGKNPALSRNELEWIRTANE